MSHALIALTLIPIFFAATPLIFLGLWALRKRTSGDEPVPSPPQ